MGNASYNKYVKIILVQNRSLNEHVSGFTTSNEFRLTYDVLRKSTIQDLLELVNQYREIPILELYDRSGRKKEMSSSLTDCEEFYLFPPLE